MRCSFLWVDPPNRNIEVWRFCGRLCYQSKNDANVEGSRVERLRTVLGDMVRTHWFSCTGKARQGRVREIHSKVQSGCLKSQIVQDPVYAFFPIHTYLWESLIYKLGTVRDEHQ